MADFKCIPLFIDAATGKQVDEFGSVVNDRSYFRLLYDETVILCCQFYDIDWSEGEAQLAPHTIDPNLVLEAFGDSDFDPLTSFMFLSAQTQDTDNMVNIEGDWIDGTTAEPLQGRLSFRVNTNTVRFAEAVESVSSYRNFYFCITGIPAGQTEKTVLAYFKFKAENRPTSSVGEPALTDPDYLTAQEVEALVRSAPVREYSLDGATYWHSVQTSADRYYREQRNGGEWGEAIALVIGPQGENGIDAFVYVAYASDNTGTDFSLTPSDSLKYRAEIHSAVELTPVESDFSGATWVKYLGSPGTGVLPYGEYNPATTYPPYVGVTYSGSFYYSLVNDNTGNQPDTSPTYWELMVAQGDTGDTGATGETGATNISINTPMIWDENFETFAYQLSDVDNYVRFGMVKSMSSLKIGVVSANPTYTGNAVIFPTTGRTALMQAGWTASTGVSGAYFRDADISGITFVTEDGILIENAASVAALVAGQWAVGDEDSIGSSRLYVYPTAGNNPPTDGDGFYRYDTVSSQTVAVGATPAEITITASFAGYKCLELWRDTFDSNDTLDNGGVVVGMNILDGAEYNK